MRFEDVTVVVTGAASGLGLAAAQRLAGEGGHIVAVDRDPAVKAVAQDLPTESIGVIADISVESDVDRYMAAGIEKFGRIDRFHLNAGIFGAFAALPDLEVDDFEQVMRVNVTGQFLGMRAAFRHYRDRRSGGAIAVTASIASLRAAADLLPYHTSKHAVVGLVRGAAVYGGPLGVRVNGVAPGIVPTRLFQDAASTPGGGDDMAARASTTPLRRAGDARRSRASSHSCSAMNSYTTGQIVAADGGASIVNTVRPAGGAGAWDVEALDAAMYTPEELESAKEARR